MQSLRNRTISGVAWSGVERFSVQGIQFVVQVILARLLTPSDYGVIAMLVVFLAIFQVFIDSGFSSALVQKHDRSEVDYSTVFYFNIGISIILFLMFFFSAPLIAKFYETPVLTSVARIVALNLIITAFAVVPRAKFMVLINFKTQAKASLVAIIISGAIGIWLAYAGYGVWALVFQSLLSNGINTLLLWILSKWWPLRTFSMVSFRSLFSFGSKLLMSSLLDTTFRNLYPLIIGRAFTAQELGLFSKADNLAQFPATNPTGIVNRVIFPVMCEVQNDDERIKTIFYKYLGISAFIIFPLMTGLAVLAEPFIRLVLTERWLGIVLFLQILCLSYMWFPVHALNLMLLKVRGRSDLFLRLEIIKKIVGVIILVITIPFGITIMCLGRVISSVSLVCVNTYYTRKYFDIGFFRQIRYILPSLLLSAGMGGIVFLLKRLNLSDILTLALGFGVGCLFYISIAAIFKMKEWKELRAIIVSYGK